MVYPTGIQFYTGFEEPVRKKIKEVEIWCEDCGLSKRLPAREFVLGPHYVGRELSKDLYGVERVVRARR